YEVFLGPNGALRTDESFFERTDPNHHNGDSPLEYLGINMMSQIPLEGLHLVDEGAMRRWLRQVWGKYKHFRRGSIGARDKLRVERLVPRLRRLTILSSPHYIASEEMVQIADGLLRRFSSQSEVLLGPQFVVYNIHSLQHLANELRQHGNIDKFSAFKFLLCYYEELPAVW
ncbi:hypothetical protein FOCC_FOCC014556, partial [Frankliniella occidentalis]